jgi:hypothetical protein
MPVIPPTPWSDLVGGMQTGDLILFSGSKPESLWIELFTGGMFSHATMISRPDPTQPPLMWQEAPSGIVPDPWVKSPDPSKSLHGGAQLGDGLAATQAIRYQYGDLPYYVQLDWNRPENLEDLMATVVSTYDGRPFGTVMEMALNYAIGHEFNISSGDATLYCAQLVAVTFMALGLFDDSHPANWYAPNSFVAPQVSDLPWLATASFKDPIQIDVPEPSSLAERTASDLGMWPAGPLAPPQLPTPPKTDWLAS